MLALVSYQDVELATVTNDTRMTEQEDLRLQRPRATRQGPTGPRSMVNMASFMDVKCWTKVTTLKENLKVQRVLVVHNRKGSGLCLKQTHFGAYCPFSMHREHTNNRLHSETSSIRPCLWWLWHKEGSIRVYSMYSVICRQYSSWANTKA